MYDRKHSIGLSPPLGVGPDRTALQVDVALTLVPVDLAVGSSLGRVAAGADDVIVPGSKP